MQTVNWQNPMNKRSRVERCWLLSLRGNPHSIVLPLPPIILSNCTEPVLTIACAYAHASDRD